MKFLRKSIFSTECDECHRSFAVNTGGVCERCRRILCNDHLHGTLWRRVAIAFGAPYLCVRCRSGAMVGVGAEERSPSAGR
ncbi:MAG TPA: hypothetical protein VNL96_04060 [Gemmatimonadaceae bacterium]|jgi:hypothetical protein|nr:hypothetical protein [Gemmatimonadaceae bacterium]